MAETYAPGMVLRKSVAAVTDAADDAVTRIETQAALIREDIDLAATTIVVAIAILAAAVLGAAFIAATARP